MVVDIDLEFNRKSIQYRSLNMLHITPATLPIIRKKWAFSIFFQYYFALFRACISKNVRIISVKREMEHAEKCREYFSITVVLFLIILFFLTIENSAADESTPDVLILNSYHQGEDWYDNQLKGIQFVFNKAYPYLVPSIEHLDTKRFPDAETPVDRKTVLKDQVSREKF